MKLKIPLQSAFALLVVACSCATEQYTRWVSPSDLVCVRDEDCIIWQGDVMCSDHGDDPVPYAISRAAVAESRRELKKRGDRCIILDRDFSCRMEPSEWKAVCSDHVCERRSALWFRDPKTHYRD